MKNVNPFTLMFGKQPGEYINRYENAEMILGTFSTENPVSQIYLIEGVRGSGKTVLMTAIANRLAEDDQWLVLHLNATQDLLQDFAMRLMDSCGRIRGFFEKGFSMSFAGFGVGINGAPERDSVSVIEELLTRLKKKNRRVLITVDEVMHDQNMRVFASQFQIFIRQDYPLFLLMTGLYENIYAVQNDPALTFLLRSPKVRLEPLSISQIVNQYKKVFQIDLDSAKELAHITKGYAFAFQALGNLYWDYGKKLPLAEILEKLDGMLDDYVYRKIWEGLSRQDKNVVLSVRGDASVKVKDVCERAGMTSSTFSQYKDRLIKRGILASMDHGYISLALPRFYEVVEKY